MRQIEAESDNPPARSPDGTYPADDFGKWLRRRLMTELGVANDGATYDYNAERGRLTKAQADKTELEVREIRGEVIRLPLVEQHWQTMVAAMRAKLLSLPTKAAGSVASPDKLQAVTDTIQGLVYEALAEIAGDAVPDEVRNRVAAQARATDADDSKSSAKPYAKPVGSGKTGAKPGRQRGAGKVSAK
ncbi:MAG: hypothetical protein ABI120_17505 [Gemmatimonadaceae bacterium]